MMWSLLIIIVYAWLIFSESSRALPAMMRWGAGSLFQRWCGSQPFSHGCGWANRGLLLLRLRWRWKRSIIQLRCAWILAKMMWTGVDLLDDAGLGQNHGLTVDLFGARCCLSIRWIWWVLLRRWLFLLYTRTFLRRCCIYSQRFIYLQIDHRLRLSSSLKSTVITIQLLRLSLLP